MVPKPPLQMKCRDLEGRSVREEPDRKGYRWLPDDLLASPCSNAGKTLGS